MAIKTPEQILKEQQEQAFKQQVKDARASSQSSTLQQPGGGGIETPPIPPVLGDGGTVPIDAPEVLPAPPKAKVEIGQTINRDTGIISAELGQKDKIGVQATPLTQAQKDQNLALGGITPDAPTAFDSGSPILDKELKDIQKEKDKKIEDSKKSFLLGKSEFEKNKQFFTNFDEIDKLYTGVIDELTASMDTNGVVPDRRYLEIANKFGLTIDEVKDPNSILNRGNLSEEGKEKFGVDKFQAGLDKMATEQERNQADLQTALERTQLAYNNQIEDVGKQMARSIGWTEAQGAWMGALRGSGFLQGIDNIRKDGETTIKRLSDLAQSASASASESSKRLTEDYNLALEEATKSLDTQLEDLKKNSILSLSEAQATYGLGSDKLSITLDAINNEYGIKSNQAVTAYLGNLKAMNDLASQNIDLIEKADTIETTKTDKAYNNYLANDGAVLQNTSLNTIAENVQNGSVTLARAKDLQNIMLNSIQATLGAIAPLTTQDLSTINTLLSQGNTPAQVIAKMREDERFAKSAEAGDFSLEEKGDQTFVFNKDTGAYEVVGGEDGPSGSIGFDFIKSQEGFSETAYFDVNGWAVGYGQHAINGVPVKEGDTIDKATADADFANRVNSAKFNGLVDVDLTENQQAALYDLEHNVGSGVWGFPNGKKIIDLVNKGDFEGASEVMANSGVGTTNAATGEVMSGLVARRKAAAKLLLGTDKEQVDFKPNSIPQYVNFLQGGKIGTNKDELAAIVEEFGSVEDFKQQAENYNNSDRGPREKELNKIKKLRDDVTSFLSDENDEALSNSVGTTQFTVLPGTEREKEDFLAIVQTFLSKKTLQNLIDVKSEGATFGALSNEELKMLQAAGSELSSLVLNEDEDDTSRITGFRGSELNFKKKVQKTMDVYNELIAKKEKIIGNTGDDEDVEINKDSSDEDIIKLLQSK